MNKILLCAVAVVGLGFAIPQSAEAGVRWGVTYSNAYPGYYGGGYYQPGYVYQPGYSVHIGSPVYGPPVYGRGHRHHHHYHGHHHRHHHHGHHGHHHHHRRHHRH